MSAHRHWRIYVTQRGTDATYCNIAEIKYRITAGGATVTGSGTASASSSQGAGFDAGKAYDTSHGTCWAMQTGSNVPEWNAYDFGAGNDKDIVEVAITGLNFAGYQTPRGFDIQHSDDGTNWTTALSVTGLSAWANNETRTYTISAPAAPRRPIVFVCT
jgi:hypothetical protein